MRKNKTIAFALAAMICVGAGALGTRAWFTDSAQVTNDLTVTMGDLDVEAEATKDWYVKSAGNTAIVGKLISNTQVKDKLQPGDVLAKDIKISNVGSLDQKLDIKPGTRTAVDGFIVADSDLTGITTLEAGKDKSVTITVTIDSVKVDDKYNKKGQATNHIINLNTIVGTYTIKAGQTNGPVEQPSKPTQP